MLKKIISISLVTILLLATLLVSGCTPAPKATTTTTVQPTILDRMTLAESRITSQDSKLTTIQKDFTMLEVKVDGIQDNDTSGIQSEINTLKSTISEQSSKLSEQSTKIESLTARLNAIPTPTPTPSPTTTSTTSGNVVSSGALQVTVKDLSSEILEGAFDFSETESIKLTVKNTGTTDLTDIRIYLKLIPEDEDFPTTYIANSMTLTGDLVFNLSDEQRDEYTFKSARFTLKAGVTKNYYLTPSITLKRMSDYPYKDKDGNLVMTNTDATLAPYTVNPTYSISKLQNDVTFTEEVEIIDYN